MKQSKMRNLLSHKIFMPSALLLILLTVTTAQAQDIYLFGETSFHYEQVWGPLEGDFFAEGAIDTTDGVSGGVIAYENGDENGTTFLHLAVSVNADNTLDLFGMYIDAAGALEPGNYPVSTTTLFFFIVGADSFIVPENPDSIDIMDLIDLIQSDYKFISLPGFGSINLTTVTDGERGGSFSGSASDIEQPLVIIDVEQGEFSLLRFPEMTLPVTVPSTMNLSCYPNPFNPATTVSLSLERPAAVNLEVFNLQGQLVGQLFQGQLPTGQHRFQFEPAALSSGTYLIRAVPPTSQISQKVQYLK